MTNATLKLTYFKPNGKYYGAGEIEVNSSTDWELCTNIVRFRFTGGCLPGLATGEKDIIVLISSDNHPMASQTILTKSLSYCASLTNSFYDQ
uniref:Uncharacterized protein n=1 Tax=Pectobacterium carotovorum TaxID=554 RepID=A0A0K0MPZ6_PECCA|nr:hypothetical protein [Pectobacterium carotovorum]AKG47517.1 hypothetical protein pA_00077 [Pectobacterium carotovorum]